MTSPPIFGLLLLFGDLHLYTALTRMISTVTVVLDQGLAPRLRFGMHPYERGSGKSLIPWTFVKKAICCGPRGG